MAPWFKGSIQSFKDGVSLCDTAPVIAPVFPPAPCLSFLQLQKLVFFFLMLSTPLLLSSPPPPPKTSRVLVSFSQKCTTSFPDRQGRIGPSTPSPPPAWSRGREVTHGDGPTEGGIDAQEGPETVESGRGHSRQSLTLSSLASGGRRGMTDPQGQGGTWRDTALQWGSPTNITDSQH